MSQFDKLGNLVFDDRVTNLKDMILEVERWFPGVDKNEIEFMHTREFYGSDAIALGKIPKAVFIDHGNSKGSKVWPLRTLAQAIRMAKEVPNCNFRNVRTFWFNGDLCMDIKTLEEVVKVAG